MVKGSISITTADKRKRAVDLKRIGWTYDQIGDDLGCSAPYAWKLVKDALNSIPATSVEEYRAQELDKLAAWERAANDVLARRHVTVSNGKIIRESHLDEVTGKWVYGDEIEDDAPVLAAIDRLVKIQDARRKLLGLDAPARAEVNVGTVDPASIELRALLEQRTERNAAERELLAESEG